MDRVITIPRHQITEAGWTGDDTEKTNRETKTPGKAHPMTDSRRLVTMRGSTDQPEIGTGGKSTRENDSEARACGESSGGTGKADYNQIVPARSGTRGLNTKDPLGDHGRGG